jgi:hypothetical protein
MPDETLPTGPPPSQVAALAIVGTGGENMRALASMAGARRDNIPKVKTSADEIGIHGRAWSLDWPKAKARLIETGVITLRGEREADHDSTKAIWIMQAPYAHPLWHSYLLVLISLEPIPGTKTMVYKLGATHEFWLAALDPNADVDACLRGDAVASAHMLRPLNFAAQIICRDDADARERMRLVAKDVIDGSLNPDTDFTQQWVARFGDSMMRK